MDQAKEELTALATHLRARRRPILETWRHAAERDPTLTTMSALSKAQFNDHIPEVLDAFERKLSAENLDRTAEAAEQQKEGAAGHGLHRWQLGYRQREVMYEWRHLHLCLVDELERYAASHANLQASVMPARGERWRSCAVKVSARARLCIGELCAGMQPLAADRGLFLESHGPTALYVEGDAVKTRRIAQNLLLNAIKYTEHGGVRVSWEEVTAGELERWVLSVQDTGPGFADGPVTPIAHALKEATDEANTVQEKVESSSPSSTNGASARPLISQSNHRSTDETAGEGIGLSIVKRSCELLDASLELETGRGKGTVFRVVFPRRYDTS